jgi:hypothetical protein
MEPEPNGPPIVPIPERVDRRLRLGPFSSAHDALKFLSYAAIASLVASIISPWVACAVAALGFGLTVYRPEGVSLDERCAAFLLWQLRSRRNDSTMTPQVRSTPSPGLLTLSTGERVAIIRANGTPTAYLPPTELSRRFHLFRGVLRGMRDGLAFAVTLEPMRSDTVIPPRTTDERTDGEAIDGYQQLVAILCRQRSVRRVDLVLRTSTGGAGGIADLETRVAGLVEGLIALGVGAVRLQGKGLAEAARRWGWSPRRTGP